MKPILITIAFILLFGLVKAQVPDTSKQIFPIARKYPTPLGGWSGFIDYLRANKKYPIKALEIRTQYEVLVTFIVEKDGSLSDVKVLNGYAPNFDKEAVRVVKESPKWNPGTQGGKPVRSQYTMEIVFHLPDQPDVEARTEQQLDSIKNLPAQDVIYTAVEQEPNFPGGIVKLYEYIQANLKYPDTAQKNGIHGNVFLSFVVEKDGSLSNIKIIKGLSPEIDAEAIRLMKECPNWNPGIQNGRPVRVIYNTPISFTLQN